MAREDTKRYSLDDLERMEARGEYARTRTDAPEIELDENFWRNARLVIPTPRKKSVHLRLDADVHAWFRDQGPGYLTRMNAVLRAYMEAHRDAAHAGTLFGHSPSEDLRRNESFATFPARYLGIARAATSVPSETASILGPPRVATPAGSIFDRGTRPASEGNIQQQDQAFPFERVGSRSNALSFLGTA